MERKIFVENALELLGNVARGQLEDGDGKRNETVANSACATLSESVKQAAAEKLHRDLDGIADMKHLPDVVVIIDVCHDEIAVKEARKLNIPIVAVVDTNGNPENIDYPIAANDDAVKSIKVIIDTFVEAVKDAAELYRSKVAEQKAHEEAEKAEKAKMKSAEKSEGEKDKRRSSAPKGDKAPAKRPAARRSAPKADAEKKADGGEKKAPKKPEAPVEVKDLADLKKSDIIEKAE